MTQEERLEELKTVLKENDAEQLLKYEHFVEGVMQTHAALCSEFVPSLERALLHAASVFAAGGKASKHEKKALLTASSGERYRTHMAFTLRRMNEKEVEVEND